MKLNQLLVLYNLIQLIISPSIIIIIMNAKRPDDDVLKLIIIGDCGVGKTNILVQFC